MTQDPTDKLPTDCSFDIRARYGECTTRVPVDQAPAGPALDAAVAELLGLDILDRDTIPVNFPVIWRGNISDDYLYISRSGVSTTERWSPSTDIAAAWELWQDAKENCWVDFIDKLEWDADTSSVFDVLRHVAPDTITRAYLKAKGVEWVEVPDETNTD